VAWVGWKNFYIFIGIVIFATVVAFFKPLLNVVILGVSVVSLIFNFFFHLKLILNFKTAPGRSD
jgi:hypothetical protein